MHIKYILGLLLLCLYSTTLAQAYNDGQPQRLSPMSIPSSPAFSLLGVNPEIVTRPSDVKEFKVDWRIKNYKLAPDLAIEAQPLWWLYYRRKSPKEFLKTNKFQKILSTLTMSLATAKIDNANHMAYAAKVNLYKEYDPYSDFEIIKTYEEQIIKEIKPLSDSLERMQIRKINIGDTDVRDSLEKAIYLLDGEIKLRREAFMQDFAIEADQRIRERWNMDMVDLAFGRVYKYDNDALDSLKFERAGYGIWLNAAKGIGKNSLITGIAKMNQIGKNRNYMLGAAYRFGSYKYNFFAELAMTRMNNVPENGFADEEQFASLRANDLGTGWYMYDEGTLSYTSWTMAYGGDFKLSHNILLNFSLRTELKSNFKFERFLPIANVVCLMK